MASFVCAPTPLGRAASRRTQLPWTCKTEVPSAGSSAKGTNARRLAKWIAAEWVNRDQAFENPQFWSYVHVVFRPLPWAFLDGYSFYTESAYDYNLDGPYKTSVVRIENDGDDNLELASYKVANAEEYWKGAYITELLEPLTPDQLTRLSDKCNTVFVWNETQKRYDATSKPGKECRITRPGKDEDTYLDSQIELTESTYSAWDIGRDVETDERVWGAALGAFEFKPLNRLDHLVPQEPQPAATERA